MQRDVTASICPRYLYVYVRLWIGVPIDGSGEYMNLWHGLSRGVARHEGLYYEVNTNTVNILDLFATFDNNYMWKARVRFILNSSTYLTAFLTTKQSKNNTRFFAT